MKQEVISWLRAAGKPTFKEKLLNEYYQTVSPRVVFLKNLTQGSRVLDLGAGDGGLAILRDWPSFARTDLRLFAVSLEHGKELDRYEEVFVGDFEESPPIFSSTSQFEAIVCAHFIEHVRDFKRAIKWMAESMTAGGRAYIEWPHSVSKEMPTRAELGELGYSTSTMNFYDDLTHVETWEIADLAYEADRNGCIIESQGQIRMPFLAERMRDFAIRHKDETLLTFAIWSFFGWAQYVVMSKTD